jgi:hypothetical protein
LRERSHEEVREIAGFFYKLSRNEAGGGNTAKPEAAKPTAATTRCMRENKMGG